MQEWCHHSLPAHHPRRVGPQLQRAPLDSSRGGRRHQTQTPAAWTHAQPARPSRQRSSPAEGMVNRRVRVPQCCFLRHKRWWEDGPKMAPRTLPLCLVRDGSAKDQNGWNKAPKNLLLITFALLGSEVTCSLHREEHRIQSSSAPL
jgi:hypothetical protein